MKCSICGNDIQPQRDELGNILWADGHNAEPINSGRCCDTCNYTVVIPKRLNNFKEGRGVFENDSATQ